MKLQKTVDGLYAAPVTAATPTTAPRTRELARDVAANAPELAKYLDFGPNSSAAAAAGATSAVAAGTASAAAGWQFNVDLGALNAWTAAGSGK